MTSKEINPVMQAGGTVYTYRDSSCMGTAYYNSYTIIVVLPNNQLVCLKEKGKCLILNADTVLEYTDPVSGDTFSRDWEGHPCWKTGSREQEASDEKPKPKPEVEWSTEGDEQTDYQPGWVPVKRK